MSERAAAPLRAPSALTVFTSILVSGPTSRTAVAQATGLTPAAVTKAVNPMLDAGLLEEHGAVAEQGVGRPRSIVRVSGPAACFLGVKLTADEAIAVAIDLAGTVLAHTRARLPDHGVGRAVATIDRLVRRLGAQVDRTPDQLTGIGVSLSGDVDRATGNVVFSPFLGWHDVALAQRVHDRTGVATTVENDVRALTFCEQWFGAGVGAQSLALVTIGQGVGCGVFAAGRVLTGSRGVSGELGHVPLGDPSARCYCGAHGCVETAASTPSILRAVADATGRVVGDLDDAIATAHDVPDARAVFDRAGRVLGRSIATVVNLVGPERVVLTGDGLAAVDLLEPQLRAAFAEHAYEAAAATPIVVRDLPFEEWARGSAIAALNAFLRRWPVY